MSTVSFREYVLNHSPEDSPAGDFIMDAKHPKAKQIPDATTWRQIERWMESIGAHAQIEGAKEVWRRYDAAKGQPEISIANGYTVADMIELLKAENPKAHVVMYHPNKGPQFSRVEGYSKVLVRSGSRTLSAIVLGG